MRLLYVAEIVGKAGIHALKSTLPELRRAQRLDGVIACADGATGGRGLGRNHAGYLRKLGVDVITMGECAFYKKDLVEQMGHLPYVLRPANLSALAPGWGFRTYSLAGQKVAVAVLLGQVGFDRVHADSPYTALGDLLERMRLETAHIVIDFHASATAEKQALFHMAEGHCSAVIGSHTRVQTSDERLMSGTAVLTDAGRTGSQDSVGGCDAESRIAEYLSGIPDWTREAWARPELQGAIVETDGRGRAVSIERIRVASPEAKHAGDSTGHED